MRIVTSNSHIKHWFIKEIRNYISFWHYKKVSIHCVIYSWRTEKTLKIARKTSNPNIFYIVKSEPVTLADFNDINVLCVIFYDHITSKFVIITTIHDNYQQLPEILVS